MIAAQVYACLCAGLVCFQISLALGAPLGHLTMGGINPGVLPPSGRVIAVLSAVLLATMAIIVLRTARGQLKTRWPIRGVLCITVMTTIANLATPSYWERALWGPVTIVLLVTALMVWWRTPEIEKS